MTKKPTNEELKERLNKLEKEAIEHKHTEEVLHKQAYDLGKRVKELDCLYNISRVIEKPGISLEEILQDTVNLIPPAWQYPEITCARIILEGKEFRTENFTETTWKQTENIRAYDESIGTLEVYYLKERAERDEGLFLKEERNLLTVITEQLGRITERMRTEEKIQHLTLMLRSIRGVNQLISKEKDRDRFLKGVCDILIENRGCYNAWIALLDESSELVTSADAGLGEDFLPMVERLKRGALTDCGQRALTQSDVVVTRDPPSTCTDCPLSDQYSGRGAMTVRLEYGGKLYGLLSASIPRDFIADAEEQSLLQEVAMDISFALNSIELEEERKRAEEMLQERIKELNCLYGISNLVEEPGISLGEILQGTIDFIPPAWQYPQITCARLICEDQTLTTNNFNETVWKQTSDIVLYGERLGSLEVFYLEERPESNEGPFLKEERSLLNAISERLGRIIERKRAEEEAKRRATQLELIYEVGQSVSGELELEALFSKIVGAVHDAFDYHNVMLELVDEEAKCMDVQSVAGAYADFFPDQHMAIGEGMTGYAAATGETQVSGDVIQDPHYVPDVEETKSELAVPIKSGQKVIGVLDLQSDEFDAFDETDVMVIETLADQVTVATENARLYEAVRQELSQRKQAQEALRESEERFRALTENTSDWIWEVDQNGIYTYASPKVKDLLGYELEEIIGKTLFDFMPADEAQRVGGLFRDIVDSREPFRGLEYTNLHKDGRHVVLETSGVPIFDAAGNLIGYRGMDRDISERKRAAEVLRESEEKYRVLVEKSPLGVSIIGQDDHYKYINPKFIDIFGYTLEDIPTGREWFRKAHPDPEYRKQVISIWFTDLEESKGELRPRTHDVTCKDGSEKVIQFRAVTMETGDQFVIYEDITEQKNLEAQLQRAQKMEAIGTLAGGVAHDLNNILAGLVSYPELLLLETPKDSPLRKPMLTIQKSGENAAAIVQDLLTLARRGIAATEVVDLNGIISEYVKSPEHEKLISFHPNVHVEANLETDLLNILGSPAHLSKTVMNLVSNAAEAMPDGGEISISTENRYIDQPIRGYDDVEEGDYVTLTISDTGVGISKKDRERIFEPFYTKKAMGRSGTGLGMAVVWGAVKDHKGYIDIQSAKRKGATFTLYFPITRKELPKDKSILSIEDYMGKGESVLVVDDVEEQREIASRILKKLGYSVTSVSSGEEAVDYLKDNSADLLLLDVIMDPGIDGLET